MGPNDDLAQVGPLQQRPGAHMHKHYPFALHPHSRHAVAQHQTPAQSAPARSLQEVVTVKVSFAPL